MAPPEARNERRLADSCPNFAAPPNGSEPAPLPCTLSRIKMRIAEAKEADQMHQALVLAGHRKRAAENAIFRNIDPSIDVYPKDIW